MLNIYNSKNHNGAAAANGRPKNNNGQKPDFEKYVDPTGELTSRKLKFELWLTRHKVLLYKISARALIVFSVIVWVFSLWQWGDWLISGRQKDADLSSDLSRFPDYSQLQSYYSPQPIQIISAVILPGSKDKSDAVAIMENPNERWLVEFDYRFAVNEIPTPVRHAWLLPRENRAVPFLGITGGFSGPVAVMLDNVVWKRISAHRIPNANLWQSERLNFGVSDLQVVPKSQAGISATAVQFKLTNGSSFGYAQADFFVGLLQGEGLAGILPLQVRDFQAGETRDIDLRSFAPGLNFDQIRLYPVINVYDKAVFMPPPK